jgi:hypothetical protein
MSKDPSRKSASDPIGRQLALVAGAIGALLVTTSESSAYDGPVFRSGLWRFERTLETDGRPTDRLQTSGLLIDRQTTRCTDPTRAMRLEFAPTQFGTCGAKDIRKTSDGYAFEKVCSGARPIKTEIDVRNDSAYTEINQGDIGKISSKEILVAQRVGDCGAARAEKPAGH